MEYKLKSGYILEVIQDTNPESPRTWCNLTKMIFFGKHKSYGDKHNIVLNDYNNREDFIEHGGKTVKKLLNCVICKPVHLYSHSGETISTSFTYPYNCRWDSGTIGFVVITKEDLRKKYNVNRITKKILVQVEKILEGEIKILDQYLTGDVYGYKISKVTKCDLGHEHNEELDSCWGFYGEDECLKEAESMVEFYQKPKQLELELVS